MDTVTGSVQELRASVPSPTVLCVDDEPTCLLFRKLVLQKSGYSVLCARNGVEALELFASKTVDCVVLDLIMPGMDGEEVARLMRKNNPKVPIIVLSASMFAPEGILNLVDAYVAKAQSPTILLRELKTQLSRQCKAHQAAS